jgi:hypothetical protein
LRHGPFGERILPFTCAIKAALDDVYPNTHEQWEEGFRRDTNPEKEIAIWLNIAGAYKHFTDGRALSPEQKQDIFQVILAAANTGTGYVPQTARWRTLSRSRVKLMVAELMSGNVMPIKVHLPGEDSAE